MPDERRGIAEKHVKIRNALKKKIKEKLIEDWSTEQISGHLTCYKSRNPPEVLYSGSALSYSIGVALFGGTMPMISNYLMKLL